MFCCFGGTKANEEPTPAYGEVVKRRNYQVNAQENTRITFRNSLSKKSYDINSDKTLPFEKNKKECLSRSYSWDTVWSDENEESPNVVGVLYIRSPDPSEPVFENRKQIVQKKQYATINPGYVNDTASTESTLLGPSAFHSQVPSEARYNSESNVNLNGTEAHYSSVSLSKFTKRQQSPSYARSTEGSENQVFQYSKPGNESSQYGCRL